MATNPAGTMSPALRGIDLVFEGEAMSVTDGPTLERLAALYREQGWRAEVEGDAFTAPYSAPSAGPPPWHLSTTGDVGRMSYPRAHTGGMRVLVVEDHATLAGRVAQGLRGAGR